MLPATPRACVANGMVSGKVAGKVSVDEKETMAGTATLRGVSVAKLYRLGV